MNAWTRNSPDGNMLYTRDLRSLALSCPALQELTAHGSVDPEADWSVLQPLQHLSGLIISGTSNEAAARLVQLTGLQLLQIVHLNSITEEEGLAHFTALRNLGTLTMYGLPLGEGHWEEKYSFMSDVSHSSQRALPPVMAHDEAYALILGLGIAALGPRACGHILSQLATSTGPMAVQWGFHTAGC